MEQIQVLSLFCGCGGLDWGFHNNSRFRVVRAFDAMKHAVETYNANFSGAEVRDVTELLSPDFDLGFVPGLITGGPPCQDFSVAGLKKLGDRANLTLTYVEVVCKYRPQNFVMENVPAIMTTGKVIFDEVIKRFKAAGYGLTVRVVYMPDYGIPQSRKRLVVLGCLGGNAYEAALDQHKNPIKSIRESGIDTGGKEHIYRHPRTYGQRAVFSIDGLYPTVRGTIRKMPPSKAFHAKDSSKNAAEILVPDWEFLAKIQSFPATFKWLPRNNADLVGNAVPPKFSAVLATIFSSRKRAVPRC